MTPKASEHPMVVLLMLRGYHLCKFASVKPCKEAAFRIKRNLVDKESQLQLEFGGWDARTRTATNDLHWILKDSSRVRSYAIIPWDELPWDGAEALTLRNIDWLEHNTGIDESPEGPH